MRFSISKVILAVHLGTAAACIGCVLDTEPLEEVDLARIEQELVMGSLDRRPFNTTACWVRDPAATAGQTAAAFWTEAARIEGIVEAWADASGLTINWTSAGGGGNDCAGTAAEDIRILLYINGVNQGDPIPSVPGGTCTQSEMVVSAVGDPVTWDFGSYPSQAANFAGCTYNARVIWGHNINQYLHEFGHSIGLAHEHDRADNNNPLCPGGGTLGPPNNPYLTRYDVDSVMHYNFTWTAGRHTGASNSAVLVDTSKNWVINDHVGKTLFNDSDGSSAVVASNTNNTCVTVRALQGGTDNDWDWNDSYRIVDLTHPWANCPAPGNMGTTGLSEADKLGIEMLYPKSYEPAFRRTGTLLRDDQSVWFMFDWIARGAFPDWLQNPQWTVTAIQGSPPSPATVRAHDADWPSWPQGEYTLQASFDDGFADAHLSDTLIKVVSPSTHTAILSPAMLFLLL